MQYALVGYRPGLLCATTDKKQTPHWTFFFHSVVSWFIGVKSAARLLAVFFLLRCSNPSACIGLTTDTSDSLTSTASSLWSEKGSLVSMRIRNYLKDYIYMCDSKTKGCIKIVCLLAGGILSQFLGLMDTGGTRTVRRELQPVHMLFCVWLWCDVCANKPIKVSDMFPNTTPLSIFWLLFYLCVYTHALFQVHIKVHI